MTKPKDPVREMNEELVSTAVFLEMYNRETPHMFPRVSMEDLVQFELTHPRLFPTKGMWSVIKHRKKVMDWLPSYLRRIGSIPSGSD